MNKLLTDSEIHFKSLSKFFFTETEWRWKSVRRMNLAMKKQAAPRKQYRKTFVREWRQHRGLTLERLADRIGMKASALSYLERGQSAYTQGTLELLADALQTDPASLIMRNPQDEEAIWSLWDQASEGERRQISEVVRALRKAS